MGSRIIIHLPGLNGILANMCTVHSIIIDARSCRDHLCTTPASQSPRPISFSPEDRQKDIDRDPLTPALSFSQNASRTANGFLQYLPAYTVHREVRGRAASICSPKTHSSPLAARSRHSRSIQCAALDQLRAWASFIPTLCHAIRACAYDRLTADPGTSSSYTSPWETMPGTCGQ